MTARIGVAVVCALALAACGGSSGEPDAGPPALPPATEEAIVSSGLALGVAAALAGPLVVPAEGLRDSGGRLDGAMREMRTRTDVESGISGMSVVEPATCATYAWAGLAVTATFTGCTLEATGESIEGSLGLAVSYFPTTFTITFSSLTVGGTQVDGSLALNVGGACGGTDLGCMPCMDSDPTCAQLRENQQTLTGSVTIRSGGTTVLEITELTLTSGATGITASGAFVIDGTAASATDLHWATGDCLPSSGSVALSGSSTTITFLATTPADGIVEVRIGAFPPVTQMLFEPCA